ncbi:MAG: single-stranded-DNA-specific exonuclease RecJ [Bryobacteraceae bacterium]|jgi:single-stranded-DNA-specific exonuclease
MPSGARWLFPAAAEEQTAELVRALHIHPLTARVLAARGFADLSKARRYLAPSLDHLHDPLLLAGMREAVARIRGAIEAGEKILIYGDYDVDGATSVVILKKAIEMAGGQADFHVPHRLRDGYGMRAEVIETAAARGVSLIVSVDTGIRASEVVRGARERGIDVIVTDHHLPEAGLPPALAVLNPNRTDCTYPDKNLCGAGVAFKLVQALIATLEWSETKKARVLESFLKLVAIATVADVVPLTGENRVIVKHGLAGLRSVRNPGLKALLEVAGFRDGAVPTAGQVAFRVAPRINAAGRMASADDVVHLFLTSDPERARAIAAQLHQLNQERQETEAGIVQAILEECERVPVTAGQAALVFCGRDWHRGVIGIVASRLVERFCRPAIVLSEDAATGQAQGSGRSIAGFHLLEALESMSDLFTRFGGHKQAAGLGLPAARVDEFRARLNAWAAQRLSADDFRPRIEIDAVAGADEIRDETVTELLALGPFGFGNPSPVLAIPCAEVATAAQVFAEKHLRTCLRQNGRMLSVTAWRFAERAAELAAGSRVDAAITVEADDFALGRGLPGWAVILKDVRPAGELLATNEHE